MDTTNFKYCNSLTSYSRFVTREVKVGDIGIGGNNPIRLQSMTTTDTMDTIKTVEQSIRMIEAGCELVRITAPSLKEAQNLLEIKNELRKRGYKTPLVADIHFTPNAAELAARIIEKVRVNPGNYADKKKFEHIDYTTNEYEAELERIRERFTPLVKICKEYGTAMRIGTNHGSLSDRILSRYGDTPLGMVESAFEFLRICEDNDYRNIVISMKASNPQVMVQAYRLLVAKMIETNRNYPLHLGVTEAGDGEDGRIKSAIGIGTLLEDGLGDTVRVSLTEEPEFEIPVARALVSRYTNRINTNQIPRTEISNLTFSPLEYNRRETIAISNIGGKHAPVVIADYSRFEIITPTDLTHIGYNYSEELDKWNITDMAADYVYSKHLLDFQLPGLLKVITTPAVWSTAADKSKYFPLYEADEYLKATEKSHVMNFVMLDCFTKEDANYDSLLTTLSKDKTVVLCLSSQNSHTMPAVRKMFFELLQRTIKNPVVIISDSNYTNMDDTLINYSIESGALLLDGFGDGVCFGWSNLFTSKEELLKKTNDVAFGILQATRTRISKTEYISCPSCGRTLFDLQETTAKIRSRTDHLKGVKIGIMGCIVNGPGEMADADYGYVGTGIGKITLYKGKEVVKRNIASEQAVDALIDLIKQHGDWVEKTSVE
ncbi:MAG: (E)-4-hydroxy-3-methylbut-2-enyl-diphosphate synthase [Bacteroidetes bacterium]|nr:(E)-4-hydroxy-3-methylbut-2-enyl-diphosphate synthase [Bacteroidota bacterium]